MSPADPSHTPQLTERQRAIDELLQEAYETRVNDIHKAIAMALEAQAQSDEEDYLKGQAYSNSHLALFYMITGKFDQANGLANTAWGQFIRLSDKAGEAAVLYTISSVFYKTDDFHSGLQYMLQAKEIWESIGDKRGTARALKAAGSIYEMFADYQRAKECYEECMTLSREIGDKMTESNATNPLSGIYLRNGELEKAHKLADTSIALKKETGDVRGLAFALHAKGKVLLKLELPVEAEPVFLEALAIHEEQNEGIGAGMVLVKLGKLCANSNRLEKAKEYLHRAVELGKSCNYNLTLVKSHYALYQIAKQEKDYESALYFLEQFEQYKETGLRMESSTKIKNLKLSTKIDMLEQESRIQKEKNEEIRAKNKELDTLIYRISHDIRGPIASLLGLHQVVELEVTDKAALSYFDLYDQLITRLNHIVMDLLNLSRVRNSQLHLVPIDFSKMVSQAIASLEYLPNYAGIQINTNVQEGLQFESDESFINSILQNLIENAIKYGFKEPHAQIDIEVSWSEEEKGLIITITDDGIGIPEELQHRIFELFFRANTETVVQGTGVGLYLTQSAVDKLGGKITLTSEVGRGTTFKVWLPVLLSNAMAPKLVARESAIT